jgi:glycosidase
MNYLFTEAAIAFTGGARVRPETLEDRSYHPDHALDGRGYADRIDWLLALYPWDITQTQLNLLDSHDTARLLNIAGGDKRSVYLATLLLMTYPGAPSIYYGDEIGLPGELDPDCRRAIQWDQQEAWDHETFAYHKAMVAMRKAHSALRTGEYIRVYADDTVYVFARKDASETLLIAVNVAEEPRQVSVPVGELFADGAALDAVWGEHGAQVSGGSVSLDIPARDGLVLAAR